MFIRHFGLGFAAKKINSKPSLGTTFLAAQFIDLFWAFFLLLGMEKVAIDLGNTAFTPLDFVSYPYSHRMLAVVIWALLFGSTYYLIKKIAEAPYFWPCLSLAIGFWMWSLIDLICRFLFLKKQSWGWSFGTIKQQPS
jgi:hypothetical protein